MACYILERRPLLAVCRARKPTPQVGISAGTSAGTSGLFLSLQGVLQKQLEAIAIRLFAGAHFSASALRSWASGLTKGFKAWSTKRLGPEALQQKPHDAAADGLLHLATKDSGKTVR